MDKDVVTKLYMDDNERFADAFNYAFFDGEQVVLPEDLVERKTEELLAMHNTADEIITKQKERDLLKQCVVRQNDKRTLILLGIENQSEVHYAMPVRNMLYDAMNYAGQVEKIAEKHRKEKDIRGAEFLSGFSKEDKLLPVITLVIYFGTEEWDGPRSIHEMLEDIDDDPFSPVNDYKIHLIVPSEIEDANKFKSNLKYDLQFLKICKAKEEWRKFKEENKEYLSKLSTSSALMLKKCAHLKLEIEEKEEDVNMCKAWDDLLEESYSKGAQEKEEEMRTIFDEMVEESYNKGAQEKEEEMRTIFDEMVEESYNKGAQEKEEEMRIALDEMQREAIRNMIIKFSVEEIINMGYDESIVREIASAV